MLAELPVFQLVSWISSSIAAPKIFSAFCKKASMLSSFNLLPSFYFSLNVVSVFYKECRGPQRVFLFPAIKRLPQSPFPLTPNVRFYNIDFILKNHILSLDFSIYIPFSHTHHSQLPTLYFKHNVSISRRYSFNPRSYTSGC